MNGTENKPPPAEEVKSTIPALPPFLQQGDWACFGITSLLMLVVYLYTISPSIDLEFSGIYTTGAMYPGVPHVPGFPLWTIYSYLFTLLPISTAAWRVNAASAVASALTCGLVGLLTCRASGSIIRDLATSKSLEPEREYQLRFICGCVAGLVFGFDGAFWKLAVVGWPWNFSVLLFTLTLATLIRWQHPPQQNRWFYAASFLYGLTLTNSQAFVPAGLGIMAFIICAHTGLGRDVLSLMTLLIVILLLGEWFGFLTRIIDNLMLIYLIIGGVALMIATALVCTTRAFFTNWRVVFTSAIIFVIGLLPYFLIPIFSMTNPPMNWAYPRTMDGFMHAITRGQYERIYPSNSLEGIIESLYCYFISTHKHFGLFYAGMALVPFFYLHRLQKPQRRWLSGMSGILISLALFMVYLMNPSLDRASEDMHAHFFTPSHLIFSILAGCGLAIVGLQLSGKAQGRPAEARPDNLSN